jgi:alpha-ketoglutarate-dependent taurine dioxygenase
VTAVEIRPLGGTVGAEVLGVDARQLGSGAGLARVLDDALEAHGVLVLREVHLPPEAQVVFCARFGAVDCSNGNHEIDGIYRVSLDPEKNRRSAAYLRGTFAWHVDGCTPDGNECPQKASVLTATRVAEHGGETDFASSYRAYDDLTDDEKDRFQALRVVHSLEASQRRVTPEPSPKQLAAWRSRAEHVHPLIWTHRSGRRSMLLGASADRIVDMDLAEGRALLDELLERATAPELVYRHRWKVGDTVMWDNRGVLHRAAPYEADSGREMLRTTILGDEPIR